MRPCCFKARNRKETRVDEAFNAFWLGQTTIEKLLLIGSIVLVMIVELLNSAVEAVVDRVGFEHHELSGRAKDIGSAAVMMSLAWAAVTWALILL